MKGKKKTVVKFIKNNKREIFILAGSTAILVTGTYCLLKAQGIKYTLFDESILFDTLKDKEIANVFATVEYIDGEIGIIEDVKAVAKALKK